MKEETGKGRKVGRKKETGKEENIEGRCRQKKGISGGRKRRAKKES